MRQRTRESAAWMIGAMALTLGAAGAVGRAAPPDDAPPQQQQTQYGDSSPGSGSAARPPMRPERLEETIRGLGLTDDQTQKIEALVQDLHQKERDARDAFLKQAGEVLSPEQSEKLRKAMTRNPPPPPPDGRDGPGPPATQPSSDADPHSAAKGTVIFQGGYDTDPRDGGRPVALVAAGLNVSPDVFRQAFSGVTPARGGESPQDKQVRLNKEALLKVLGPYGVTNDRLDTVSNYYRYSRSRGQMWRTVPASAQAIITDGVVTDFTIANPGAGYTVPPTILVVGFDNLKATATLAFGTDLQTNGSIKSITVDSQGR